MGKRIDTSQCNLLNSKMRCWAQDPESSRDVEGSTTFIRQYAQIVERLVIKLNESEKTVESHEEKINQHEVDLSDCKKRIKNLEDRVKNLERDNVLLMDQRKLISKLMVKVHSISEGLPDSSEAKFAAIEDDDSILFYTSISQLTDAFEKSEQLIKQFLLSHKPLKYGGRQYKLFRISEL